MGRRPHLADNRTRLFALIDVLIGVIWGAISGIRGGRTDEIMMRIADILWAIPSLLMTILLLVVMGKGLITMIVAMVITGWINMARIVRGQVLQLKNQEFVLASRTLGAKNSRIIRKHLAAQHHEPDLGHHDINRSYGYFL
nr:ABC transporter permease [Bacillus licheniformis]